jgi:hypothetical protein
MFIIFSFFSSFQIYNNNLAKHTKEISKKGSREYAPLMMKSMANCIISKREIYNERIHI